MAKDDCFTKRIEAVRAHYNSKIRAHPFSISLYCEFALFEELLREHSCAREIYERAAEKNYKNVLVWKKYASFELRQRCIDRCRDVLDRGVRLNPGDAGLWLFYIDIEDKMDNIGKMADMYRRMASETGAEECYWQLYRVCAAVDSDMAMDVLEEMNGRFESVRVRLEMLEKTGSADVVKCLLRSCSSMDEQTCRRTVSVLERAGMHEEAFQFVKRGKFMFQSEFFRQKYRKMRAAHTDEHSDDRCSSMLCQAAQMEKQHDIAGAEQMYKHLIKAINRKYRTKAFVHYSKFLIRQGDLQRARRNYGKAIGQKMDVFKEYIQMEKTLNEKERVRQIFTKYLEQCYHDACVWLQFIEFEENENEMERAEYLFKHALQILEDGRDVVESEYRKRTYHS